MLLSLDFCKIGEILLMCHSPELRSGFRNLVFIEVIDPEILKQACPDVGRDSGQANSG